MGDSILPVSLMIFSLAHGNSDARLTRGYTHGDPHRHFIAWHYGQGNSNIDLENSRHKLRSSPGVDDFRRQVSDRNGYGHYRGGQIRGGIGGDLAIDASWSCLPLPSSVQHNDIAPERRVRRSIEAQVLVENGSVTCPGSIPCGQNIQMR
jgi:hypothetical protein